MLDIQHEMLGFGPLEPLRVLVPNRHVRAWAQLGIARRTGIAAHVTLEPVSRYAADLVRRDGVSRRTRGGVAVVLLRRMHRRPSLP